MPSAATPAGHTYFSNDRVYLMTFHNDLKRGWPEHLYHFTPQRLVDLVKERYGDVLDADFFTNHRMAFDHAPLSTRSLNEARAWVEAGFRPVHDLRERKAMSCYLERQVRILRPNVVVCIANTSMDIHALQLLENSGIKVVVLSPMPAGHQSPHTVETVSLRDFAAGKVPRPEEVSGHASGRDGMYRTSSLPSVPETQVLDRIERRDFNLHEQILSLLTATDGVRHPDPVSGLVYQYKNGRLPDVILAMMLIMDEAPGAEEASTRVDQRGLLFRLRKHGTSNPERNDNDPLLKKVGLEALLILHETGELLRDPLPVTSLAESDNPGFYFAHLGETRPVYRYARAFCNVMRAWQKREEIEESIPPPSSSNGKTFLEACYAALETFLAQPDNADDEVRILVDAWCRINGQLVPKKNKPLTVSDLEELRLDSALDERLKEYALHGIRDHAEITRFEKRVEHLLDRCTSTISSFLHTA